MKQLLFATTGLLALTGCLDYDRMILRFDTKTLSGEIVYRNLVSDDPSTLDADYEELARHRDTPQLESQNPGWKKVEKELYEEDEQLHGRVTFSVDDLAGAHIYQHDRRSPYIYCSGDAVLWSNGRDISHALEGCVAWNRRAKTLEVEFGDGVSPNAISLLSKWQQEGSGTGELE